MRELRYIEVYDRAGRSATSGVGAVSRAALRGPGFDFDEHQPYRPGDDVRRIDWNVTARHGRAVRAAHARRARAEHDDRDRRLALDGARHVALLEAGNDDVHHRARSLFSALVGPDQHRLPRVLGSRAHVAPAAAHARGRVGDPASSAGPRTAGSGRTALVPMVRHLLADAEADEHRVPRVRLHDRRRPVRRARPGDAGGAARRHRRRPGRSLRARAARRARVRAGARSRIRPQRGRRPRGAIARSATRPRRAGVARRSARAFYRVPMEHVFVPTDESPVEPLLSLFASRSRR